MKGVVFVELLNMAESLVGEDAVDQALETCPIASKGAYTRVGTYPCAELTALVASFSAASGAPAAELQRRFGHWMHDHFVRFYPGFFAAQADAFAMLASVEDEVHVEVRKLYPDAELPSFGTQRLDPQTLLLTYRSPRMLVDFCHGLIEACLAHYQETADIARLERSDGADFTIRRTS